MTESPTDQEDPAAPSATQEGSVPPTGGSSRRSSPQTGQGELEAFSRSRLSAVSDSLARHPAIAEIGRPDLGINITKIIDAAAGVRTITNQAATAAGAVHNAANRHTSLLHAAGVPAATSALAALSAAGVQKNSPLAAAMRTSEAVSAAARVLTDATNTTLTQNARAALTSTVLAQPLGHQIAALANVNRPYLAPAVMANWTPKIIGLERIMGMATVDFTKFDVTKFYALNDAVMRQARASISLSTTLNHIMRQPTAAITAMMRHYSQLARFGDLVARMALRDALEVKDAVLKGGHDVADMVEQFLLNWLGFRKVNHELVASAILVIADVASWLPTNIALERYDPRPKLRTLTLAEHRRSERLIIDPKARANGQPISSLNTPVLGTNITLLDVVAGKAQQADDVDLTDTRLLAVRDKLTDRERRIFEKYGHERNWVDAAVACGEDPGEGEKVRRKARRFGGLINAAVSTDYTAAQLPPAPPAAGEYA